MICPKCKSEQSHVVDSRDVENGHAVRRRRECEACGKRYTTYERIELGTLTILKKGGARELYDRSKLERGLWRALEKRPVSQEQVSNVIDDIESGWRDAGIHELASWEIGEAVMHALKKLDEVAYIRFASVYREFKDVDEFRREMNKLFRKP